MWAADKEAMSASLLVHDAVLRGAIERNGVADRLDFQVCGIPGQDVEQRLVINDKGHADPPVRIEADCGHNRKLAPSGVC